MTPRPAATSRSAFVLGSTTNADRPGFHGPGTNLANLFNLTGVTNRNATETELWDTWIVGAPILGKDIDTTITLAVIDDLNHNGIVDDAPDVVTDANHHARINAADLTPLGVASNITTIHFHLAGDEQTVVRLPAEASPAGRPGWPSRRSARAVRSRTGSSPRQGFDPELRPGPDSRPSRQPAAGPPGCPPGRGAR